MQNSPVNLAQNKHGSGAPFPEQKAIRTEMGPREVLHLLTCYIDFPEQLLLNEAQGVDEGSCVDYEGDPLAGTVQERHISDVSFQDFHLSLTLELCRDSRKQSTRPCRHPKKMWWRADPAWQVLTVQEQQGYFKAVKQKAFLQDSIVKYNTVL